MSEICVTAVAKTWELSGCHSVDIFRLGLEGKGRCKRSWVLRRSGGAREVAGMH
jgi:hypothetical protein